jgi:Tfp pilus assembly protein PilN
MLNKLQHINLFQRNTVAGIDINILKDNEFIFQYVQLKKNKQAIIIDDLAKEIDDVETLTQRINPKDPVILNISGKGIIHRKIDNEELTEEEMLQKVFPNASVNDFYVQQMRLDDKYLYLSVIRKKTLHEIIDLFKSHHLHILNIFLGPFAVSHIIPFIDHSQEEIVLPDMKLSTKEQNIIGFQASESDTISTRYSIGSDQVPALLLKAFSAAFSYFLDEESVNALNIPSLKNEKEEFTYKQIFIKAGWGVLIILFALLLGNYMVFTHYKEKQARLSSELGRNKATLSKIESLKDELNRKKQFIKEKNLLGKTKLSFFADRIAHTIPREIVLEQLAINPVAKKVKEHESIEIIHNTIVIRGTTRNSTILNQWIETLKGFQWIKKLDIMNYTQETLYATGDFTLEIELDQMEE